MKGVKITKRDKAILYTSWGLYLCAFYWISHILRSPAVIILFFILVVTMKTASVGRWLYYVHSGLSIIGMPLLYFMARSILPPEMLIYDVVVSITAALSLGIFLYLRRKYAKDSSSRRSSK